MSLKWRYWKILLKDLLLYQVAPTASTSMLLTITRVIDSMSGGLSSKVVLGSPIYMWVLTTLFAIQLLVAGYTSAIKIRSRIIEWKTKTWVNLTKKLTEIKESYTSIASSWKNTFSTRLLTGLLDITKAKRVQFYRSIDPRFKVEKDDLNAPVIIENGYTSSTTSNSLKSSIFSRQFKKIYDMKQQMGK